jgi:hypothetical protein
MSGVQPCAVKGICDKVVQPGGLVGGAGTGDVWACERWETKQAQSARVHETGCSHLHPVRREKASGIKFQKGTNR